MMVDKYLKVRYVRMSKEDFVSITKLPLEKLRRKAKTSYLYERALDIALPDAPGNGPKSCRGQVEELQEATATDQLLGQDNDLKTK